MQLLANLEPHEFEEYPEFLGAKFDSNIFRYRIPDNYTNRIILGKNVVPKQSIASLKYSDRLLDFQVDDVLKMVNSTGFLNMNLMGSGKTIETIVACMELNAQSVLIVCPKAVIGQWVSKIKEWWGRDALVYETNAEVHIGQIVVTNYEKLTSKKSEGVFSNFIWDILVLDEAHYIKNRTAKRTEACKKIPARRKYALTGTPILRNPDDLWSILHFLNPKYSGQSYWNFVYYYCKVVEGYFGREIKGLTEKTERVELLNKLLEAVSCRHTLPVAQGKNSFDTKLIMSKKQSTLYNKIRKLTLDELPDSLTIPNGAVLKTRLIQTTSCPKLIDANNGPGIKFDWILETIKSNPEEKFVVFSKFEKVISHLQNFLEENSVSCATYTGKLSQGTRLAEKKRFIQDESCRALLGTTGALGTGVDELQTVCHICIFVDREYSPELNKQCEDRLNRMGQQKPVLCYYLECEKTVDHNISYMSFTRAEDIRKALND